jgi:hypothetical protein
MYCFSVVEVAIAYRFAASMMWLKGTPERRIASSFRAAACLFIRFGYTNVLVALHQFYVNAAALTPGHAGVRPMDRDELVRYSRQIGERREAWREQCAAHLQDLRRVYPASAGR